MADPQTALDTHAREELGIDPDELGGSPWVAAGASFALFVVGAIVPVLPFVFLEGTAAVAVAVLVSVVGLFVIGAAITLLTGRSVMRSGLRQLAFGLAAAAVTYGIGSLFDVVVRRARDASRARAALALSRHPRRAGGRHSARAPCPPLDPGGVRRNVSCSVRPRRSVSTHRRPPIATQATTPT